MQSKYSLHVVPPQGTTLVGSERPGNITFHLREAKTACLQFKLTLRRLQCCFPSHRTRSAIDPLCLALDAAMGSLERLPVGRLGDRQ
jgi:hypothetical protein